MSNSTSEMSFIPGLNTSIVGAGKVVEHEPAGNGMRRLVVARAGEYPDVRPFLGMLPRGSLVAFICSYTRITAEVLKAVEVIYTPGLTGGESALHLNSFL